MNRLFLVGLFLLFHFISTAQHVVKCQIRTSLGNIELELDSVKAPKTVANFLRYVDRKLYDGTNFYRVCTPENEKNRSVRIEVIQGGDVLKAKQFAPVPIERTSETGLKHLNGSISMARDQPNTATSSFFICIDNQPELDFGGKRNPDGQGFAAFGRIISGMEVVKKIQSGDNKDQYLVDPVTIESIRRIF
jgi:peptidyl-prolyl cis-trans isomerase A (cyclophilin A)